MQSKAKQSKVKQSKKSKFKLKLAGVTCGLLLSTSSVYAVPAVQGAGCGLTTANTSTSLLFLPDTILGANDSAFLLGNNLGLLAGEANPNFNPGEGFRACFFPSLPTLADMDTTCNIVTTEIDLQTNYIAFLHTNALPQPTFCLYQYDVDTAAGDIRTNGAVVTLGGPTAVPIFTPLGILAMMSGLLWFGKRRRKFK